MLDRLPVRFGLGLVFAYVLFGALAWLLLTSCSSSLLPAGPRPDFPQHLPGIAPPTSPRASSTADPAAVGSETLTPAAALSEPAAGPALSRSDFRPGRGGDKDYVRALKTTSGPRILKLKGGSAFSEAGSTLTAATGNGAAAAAPAGLAVAARRADAVTPVLGDGNDVVPPVPKPRVPLFSLPSLSLSSWLWVVALVLAVVLWVRHLNRS